MLCVAKKTIMLSVVILTVVMLSVVTECRRPGLTVLRLLVDIWSIHILKYELMKSQGCVGHMSVSQMVSDQNTYNQYNFQFYHLPPPPRNFV